MADTQRELDAFFALFGTFDLSRPVVSVSDLSDGTPLLEVLGVMCVYTHCDNTYHNDLHTLKLAEMKTTSANHLVHLHLVVRTIGCCTLAHSSGCTDL